VCRRVSVVVVGVLAGTAGVAQWAGRAHADGIPTTLSVTPSSATSGATITIDGVPPCATEMRIELSVPSVSSVTFELPGVTSPVGTATLPVAPAGDAQIVVECLDRATVPESWVATAATPPHSLTIVASAAPVDVQPTLAG
jgi:hypothetical protein